MDSRKNFFYRFLHRKACARSIALACLFAFVAASIGFPRVDLRPMSSNEAYPCANHACGCSNAEHCWLNCCCHTASEKLAWARSHQVTLPKDIETHLSAQASSSAKPAQCSSCRSKKSKRACCDTRSKAAKLKPSEDRLKWVIGFESLKCRGHSTDWLSTGFVLNLSDPDLVVDEDSQPLAVFPLPIYQKLRERPDIPPPKSYS